MSDHGYRFEEFHETILGFYEDSLPFFFFRLPPTLKAKYPEWYSNLKRNSRQLVSPLDLHSALTHILYDAKSKIENPSIKSFTNYTSIPNSNRDGSKLKGDGDENATSAGISIYRESASPQYRARYSFFKYIPGNRSCESSSIPQRYCMCGVTSVLTHFSTLSPIWETLSYPASITFSSRS